MMKKKEWQSVYTPNNEEMCERRVRQTLSGLQEDAPARRISGRRMMLIAAAFVLMLVAAVAVAAGWIGRRSTTQSGWRIRRWTTSMALRGTWTAFSSAPLKNKTGRRSSPTAPTKTSAITRESWATTPLRSETVRRKQVGRTTAKPSATIFPPTCGIPRCWRVAWSCAKPERNGMKSRERCLGRTSRQKKRLLPEKLKGLDGRANDG